MTGPLPGDARAIGTRYLEAGGQRVPVELRQNERGSVAARFFVGSGVAIIDAPTADAALKLVQCAIDALAPARPGSRG